ncbi:hypothetical protein C9374_006370 [Naegleria lovaniensis]|uniref:F-box domain-containing protein n=1 Tax=Naegleria lovaniensis TaxID=51637 RepID=A0AA88KME7_NAELO|nr:uncharacterized protein C9374_006370 [Naegleria lovaniensis]KAG2381381.1 hypothetical protein C9374_006370 [Naegleria lovaniensis]
MNLFRCFFPVKEYLEVAENNRNHSIIDANVISYHIIPYLNQNDVIRFAGVCSSWRSIVKSSQHDTTFRLAFELYDLSKQKLPNKFGDVFLLFDKVYIECFTVTKSHLYSIFTSTKISTLTLRYVSAVQFISNASLTELNVTNDKPSLNEVKAISKHFPSLKSLKLCYPNYYNGDKLIKIILQSPLSEKLESLTISSEGFTSKGFNNLFQPNVCLSNLKVLSLEIVHRYITDTEIVSINNFDSSRFPKLRSLEFVNIDLDIMSLKRILNSGIQFYTLKLFITERIALSSQNGSQFSLIDKIPSLHEIIIHLSPFNCFDSEASESTKHQITDHVLHYLTSYGTQHLCLPYCNSSHIVDICDTIDDLKTFIVCDGNIDTNSLELFCDKFSTLTTLDIRECNIGSSVKYITKLKHLTTLHVGIWDVSSEGAKYIFMMETLTDLSLINYKISNTDLKHFAKGKLRNLKTLRLTRRIPSDGVGIFATTCLPHALKLELYQVTDKAMEFLSNGNLRIHDLTLCRTNLNSNGIKFALQIKSIEKLRMPTENKTIPQSDKDEITKMAKEKHVKLCINWR